MSPGLAASMPRTMSLAGIQRFSTAQSRSNEVARKGQVPPTPGTPQSSHVVAECIGKFTSVETHVSQVVPGNPESIAQQSPDFPWHWKFGQAVQCSNLPLLEGQRSEKGVG